MGEKEQRRDRRIDWRGIVQVIVPGEAPIDAKIADISEAGCGLDVAKAVATGLEVGINGDVFEASGIVRYCFPRQGGFRLGVELKPPQ